MQAAVGTEDVTLCSCTSGKVQWDTDFKIRVMHNYHSCVNPREWYSSVCTLQLEGPDPDLDFYRCAPQYRQCSIGNQFPPSNRNLGTSEREEPPNGKAGTYLPSNG